MIKRILVSQPRPTTSKSPYFDLEERYGVEIDFRPFIKVERLTPKEFRAQKVDILAHTAVVFTSRHAIDHYFNLCREMRITVPETMKYFCITETVALYIQHYVQYRKRKVFHGTTGRIEDLLPHMVRHKAEKYLVPQSSAHTDEISRLFTAKKLHFTECIMYQTVSNDFGPDEKLDYDMLVFFSPSGIKSLFKNFPDFVQGDVAIATLGPTTAQMARDAGLRLDIEAPNPTYPSMPMAMGAYIRRVNEPDDEE